MIHSHLGSLLHSCQIVYQELGLQLVVVFCNSYAACPEYTGIYEEST